MWRRFSERGELPATGWRAAIRRHATELDLDPFEIREPHEARDNGRGSMPRVLCLFLITILYSLAAAAVPPDPTCTGRDECLEVAEEAMDQGRLKEAAGLLRRVLAEVSGVPRTKEAEEVERRAANNLAIIQLKQGAPGDALETLRRVKEAMSRAPRIDRARYLYNQGVVLRRLDRSNLALRSFRRSLDLDPDFPRTVDAIYEIAVELPKDSEGSNVFKALVRNVLEDGDLEAAGRYVKTVLEDRQWSENPHAAKNVLTTFLHYAVRAQVSSDRFDATWRDPLNAWGGAVSDRSVRSLIRQIIGYFRSASVFDQESGGADPYWKRNDERRALVADLLKQIGDDRYLAGLTIPAFERYLLSVAVDPDNTEAPLWTANMVSQDRSKLATLKKHAYQLDAPAYTAVARACLTLEDGWCTASVSAVGVELFLPTDYKVAAALSEIGKKGWALMSPADQISAQGAEIAKVLFVLDDELDVTDRTAGRDRRRARANQHGTFNDSGVTTIAMAEIEDLPISADVAQFARYLPYVRLAQHDVGGTAAGQQSFPVAGSAEKATVALDGIELNPLPTQDDSPAYVGLREMYGVQLLRSGDISIGGGGPEVNIVTRRGDGGRIRGSGSLMFNDNGFQGPRSYRDDDFGETQEVVSTDLIDRINEVGFEFSQPLTHPESDSDRQQQLWGGLSAVDNRQLATGGQATDIELLSGTLNLDLDLKRALIGLSAHRSENRQDGRGAGISRSPETTWDHNSTADLLRLQAGVERGDSYYELRYSFIANELSLDPRDGLLNDMVLDETGLWGGSFRRSRSDRKSNQLTIQHDRRPKHRPFNYRLGFQFRDTRIDTQDTFGARNAAFVAGENLGAAFGVARFYRSQRVSDEVMATALWLEGVSSRGLGGSRSLTLHGGLRIDDQRAQNRGGQAAAHPLESELLPAVRYDGGGDNIDWLAVSPRFGLGLTLGKNWLLRTSYERWASKLKPELVRRLNPLHRAYFEFSFVDANGNLVLDADERESLGYLTSRGVDPRDPASGISPNVNDGRLDPEYTDQLRLGLEWTGDRTMIGFELKHQELSDLLESRPLIRDGSGVVRPATAEDYLPEQTVTGVLPNGEPFQVVPFGLHPDLEYTGGTFLTNGDRRQEALGASLMVSKHSSRSFLHGQVDYEDREWQIGPTFRFFDDPSGVVQFFDHDGIPRADLDGDAVVVQTTDSGEANDPVVQGSWSFLLTGSFQLLNKWNVGLSLSGSEGFPLPYYVTRVGDDGLTRRLRAAETTASRLEDIVTLDVKLVREFTLTESVSASLAIDAFNLFNQSAVVQRDVQLNGPQANFLRRTLNPRVARFGIYFRF